ncbi:hypothetical protein FFI16_008135 [Pseudomonas sp. KBS0710]|nr:hypothetical protein FFI16_008135 [Pseudomonas sp. KBS0710]
MRSAADLHALKSCFSVGAGLPAMQTPRYIRYTELMLSQASQLQHCLVVWQRLQQRFDLFKARAR